MAETKAINFSLYYTTQPEHCDLYFYPEFVVLARSNTEFEILPINKVEIAFERTPFMEEKIISSFLPKDAKLLNKYKVHSLLMI